jgi:hypothetical protein
MSDLLAQLDAIARVHLVVKRAGGVVDSVHGASDELRRFAVFTGLAEVLGVEAGRQPVQREERRRVEEERALDDPST